MLAARRREIDTVVCWRLDRLGRDLAHLLAVVNEWTTLGVAFISLGEGIDATTAAGALQLHILGALAQFERERSRERVRAGLVRARRQGKRVGRPAKALTPYQLDTVAHLSVRAAAKKLGVSKSVIWAARQVSENPVRSSPKEDAISA
jgi:DNA invertase Pin-like site-specific DNA recombinase